MDDAGRRRKGWGVGSTQHRAGRTRGAVVAVVVVGVVAVVVIVVVVVVVGVGVTRNGCGS